MRAELFASGFSRPVCIDAPSGDNRRIFIVEENLAQIHIVKDGQLLVPPFLDISHKVEKFSDQGLYAMAFHPDYANNRKFYVIYTDLGGFSVIEQYRTFGNDPDRANPDTGVLILPPVPQPFTDHNGTCVRFGPDGKLYASFGDGGCCQDPMGHGQDGSTLLGSMLRLDVDIPFPHIPADNPFVGDPTVRDEIWSIGWRSPWRFSFDRETGYMYVGDVGEDEWEEVDIEPPGAGGRNYGWRCMEGFACTGLSGCVCDAGELTLPIEVFPHEDGLCSVTGGYVYRGCALPELYGSYFYGDFCTGRVFSFPFDGVKKGPTVEHTAELDPGGGLRIDRPAGFGEDGLGELYIADHKDGEIWKIVRDDAFVDCNANGTPDDCDVLAGVGCDSNADGVLDECDVGVGVGYCTAKTTSCGSVPWISSEGMPSATATSGFFVRACNARGPSAPNVPRAGVLIYGNTGPASSPFEGGYLCVDAPRRAKAVQTHGTVGQCDGFVEFDMNAFASGALGGMPAAYLQDPGTQINCQWWGRDNPSHGSYLSNALAYVIGP